MKLFKKAGALILCAALTFAVCTPGGFRAEAAGQDAEKAERSVSQEKEQTDQTTGQEGGQDTETLSRITLSVGDGQKTPTYKAGAKAELKINVANNGNTAAQNVRITPVVEKPEEWPFEMDQLNYDKSLGEIEAGKQVTAVWGNDDSGKLSVRTDVTGKSYRLTFKITYDDGSQAYETDKYVFVRTEAKKASSSGDKNTGDKDTTGSTGGATGGNGAGTGGSVSGGGGSGGDISGGSYDGGVYNSDPVSLGGDGGSTADASVPRVIVTGFDTEPAEVKAGDDFKLIVHLKNTSKKTAVSNMLFDLQAPAAGTDEAAEAPAFLPASGSSSIYLDGIPANGTKDISIELNSRADLIRKPYSITMSMKYENSDAVQFESESSLAIPVNQEARFEFSDIEIMPDTAEVGEEANITCNIYNLGRVKMYNVKVGFEGDAIEGEEQFLGNLESGATGMIDGIVTAVAESYEESNCKLVLSYEDDSGNVTTAEQEFTMMVTAPQDDMVMDDMPVMEEEDGGHGGLIVGIVLAVIILAAVIAVVIVKRRKKRKQLSEEEELFDEVERSAEDESGES